MHSKALEVLVGFFVCLGIAAIFTLTFRVASVSVGYSEGDSYEVTALFQNIGSLKPGAPISMAGVKIGRVKSIEIDRDTFEARVTMQLSKDYDGIPEDSSAKILTAGLLGEQYIGLEPGGLPDPLTDGSELMLTQSALVLENLVGQFLSGQGGDSKDDQMAKALDRLADAIAEKSAQ